MVIFKPLNDHKAQEGVKSYFVNHFLFSKGIVQCCKKSTLIKKSCKKCDEGSLLSNNNCHQPIHLQFTFMSCTLFYCCTCFTFSLVFLSLSLSPSLPCTGSLSHLLNSLLIHSFSYFWFRFNLKSRLANVQIFNLVLRYSKSLIE